MNSVAKNKFSKEGKNMHNSSKAFGLLLALLAVCLFGQITQAKYGGGSGIADDPYQIATAADI